MFINSERVSWARELSLEGVHNLAKRSTWKFGQVNEVFLMEKINCMHSNIADSITILYIKLITWPNEKYYVREGLLNQCNNFPEVCRVYFLSLYWLNIPQSICSHRVAPSVTHRLGHKGPWFNSTNWRFFGFF